MLLDKLITFFSTEIKTYFSFPKKVTKAFELYEEKLVILAQKLSPQTSISNDDYNSQTEYYPLIGEDGNIKYIPTTEL